MDRVNCMLAYTPVSEPSTVPFQFKRSSPFGKALTPEMGSIISCISSVCRRFATWLCDDIVLERVGGGRNGWKVRGSWCVRVDMGVVAQTEIVV